MRSLVLAAVGAAVLTLAGASTASAQFPGRYYGNGNHDFQPHLHKTYTPYGPTMWYGNGFHDFDSHNHSITPWGGVRSYGYGQFGPTKSYNGFPGGYGGYYGGGYYGGGYGYGFGGGYYPW